MPNRYTRDEIIKVAIDMAVLPNLEVHDVPNGVVSQNAFSIQWLQDILDYWYHMIPMSATVDKVNINCTANSDTVVLPSDFIVDVRNGLLVQSVPGNNVSFKKAGRLSLQKFINSQLQNQYITGQVVNYPIFYCVAGDDGNIVTQYQTMLVTPTPTINTICQLWYYKLPPRLEANQRPKMADDYVCVEYVRLRALEWAGIAQLGTAHKYCAEIVSKMKASGLFNEPEDDSIPMSEQVYSRTQQTNINSWMGPV
jgi:hypothetical protein